MSGGHTTAPASPLLEISIIEAPCDSDHHGVVLHDHVPEDGGALQTEQLNLSETASTPSSTFSWSKQAAGVSLPSSKNASLHGIAVQEEPVPPHTVRPSVASWFDQQREGVQEVPAPVEQESVNEPTLAPKPSTRHCTPSPRATHSLEVPAELAAQRVQVIHELIASEVRYINDLHTLVREFALPCAPKGFACEPMDVPEYLYGPPPFRLWWPDPSPRETAAAPAAKPRRFSWTPAGAGGQQRLCLEHHQTIFRDVHTLLPLNVTFLEQLLAATQGTDHELPLPASAAGHVLLGDVLSQFSAYFKMYSAYVAGHSASNSLINELVLDSSFASWTSWLAGTVPSRKGVGARSLSSFLIMPVQRIPRYALLVKELLAATPAEHADFQPLQAALVKIETAAASINESISSAEARAGVVSLQESLKPKPSPSLVGPSQRVEHSGWLAKVTGRSTREYLVVLLTHCLVYAAQNTTGPGLAAHKEAYAGAKEAVTRDGTAWTWPAVDLALTGSKLSLHNVLRVNGVEVVHRGQRPALKIAAEPKSITLLCDSEAEQAAWAAALREHVAQRITLRQRRSSAVSGQR